MALLGLVKHFGIGNLRLGVRIMASSVVRQRCSNDISIRFYANDNEHGSQRSKKYAKKRTDSLDSTSYDDYAERMNKFSATGQLLDKCNVIIYKWLDAKNLTKTLEALEDARKVYPAFQLLRPQVVKLGQLMLNEAYTWHKVFTLFADHKASSPPFINSRYVLDFLFTHADTADTKHFRKIVDAMVDNNLVVLDKHVKYGLFIVNAARLKKLPEAIRLFEQQCAETKSTVGKVPIMTALIEIGDMETLNEFIKKLVAIIPKPDALFALGHSHIEAGNIEEARHIFKQCMLLIDDRVFWNAIKDVIPSDIGIRSLDGFLESTKQLKYNRHDLYKYILSIYCGADRTQEAVGLFHKYIGEVEKPKEQFCAKLHAYLVKKDIEVPRELEMFSKNNSL